MRTIAFILLIYFAVFLMGMLTGLELANGYDAKDIDVLSIEPQDYSQRAWFLTEHEYAAKELYYSIQAGEYGNYRQLLEVIRKYQNCFYLDYCN